MKNYLLYCTVCKANFESKQQWNLHLLQKYHQDKARVDLFTWDKQIRTCGIVVYSKHPQIVHFIADEIIQRLSSHNFKFVADFVLCPSRLRVALVLLGSSQHVEELVSKDGSTNAELEMLPVQIRKLGSLLEYEWEDILHSFQEESNDTSEITTSQVLANGTEGSPIFSVSTHFQSLLNETRIPDSEFTQILDIISEMKRVYQTIAPECDVAMYHWNFLQFRNSPDLYLLHLQNFQGFKNLRAMERDLETHCSTETSDTTRKCSLNNFKYIGDKNLCKMYSHLKLGIQFQISTFLTTFVHSQLSRLIIYYCEFDTRIKPLFCLLNYWMNVNSIKIAMGSLTVHHSYTNVPHPAALEWMLLFFLYQSEKLIPAPKKILDRPHEIIFLKFKIKKKKKEIDLDVGFDFDLDWAAKWKKSRGFSEKLPEESPEYFWSILTIFHKFLLFYIELLKTPRVLNTRGGKILKMKYTISKLRNSDESVKLVVTHPFENLWKLKVDNGLLLSQVLPGMENSAKKLGEYIEAKGQQQTLCESL